MYDILEKLVDEFNLGGFGVCSFSEVSDSLIKCRALSRIPKDAKSIITFIFPYYVHIGVHNVSRYAVVKDYHNVVMGILREACRRLSDTYKNYVFEPFCDNSPIPEVKTAVLCGLGVQGENNLLINKRYGSWVFIGEIVTDMSIEGRRDIRGIKKCLSCGRCRGICPSGALCSDGFKRDICVSHLSQKKKLESEREIQLLKSSKLVWGCDECQEICPMNDGAESTKISHFLNSIHENLSVGHYDLLSERAYHWRPKDVIERTLRLKIN